MSKEATARSAISAERAMKLALEALKRMKRYGNTFAYRSHEQNPHEQVCEAIAAIEALAEQPAQQQQEPVAWRVKVETKLRDGSVDFGYQLRNERLSKYDEPLYTSPQAQRKPLTDEQIEREWQFLHDEEGNPPDHYDFARAIEAAHGIGEKK